MDNKNNFSDNYQKIMEKAVEEEKKSISGFFVRNFRLTYLVIIAIVFSGIYSLLTLPKEAEPEIKVPYAVVTTIYPGANPVDMEEMITDKIEKKIENLENLNKFESSSGQGFSSIFLEFDAAADLQESFRKLREAVDNVESELPDEAETPVVSEINFNDFPIVTYSLLGDYTEEELKKYADIIQDNFENISNVSEAKIIGGIEKEFQIIVNQTRLAHFNISMGQIVNAIRINNFSLPSGNIEIDGFKYDVRVKGKFLDTTDLNNVVVATYDNSPVFLQDIAIVKEGIKDKNSESRIGLKNQGSKETISLQIYKKTGGNILNIVKDSQKTIDELYEKEIIPKDLQIIKTNDNSVFIRKDIKTLGSSALQTMILICLILMLILSMSGAIITSLGIPIAFLITFSILKMQGMTLNSMVLFSLVLSLGLMVDNAIIVIEGINEYVSKYKKSIMEASLLSIWNFKWAIIAGTMTTVSAFLPMLLVSGIMGEYMSILPKTITTTLISSLFVAIIVIPTLATRFMKKEHKHNENSKKKQKVEAVFKKIYGKYIPFMKSVLPYKHKRKKIIIISVVMFILAVATPISGLMKVEMFPKVDIDYFVINIELPVGSVLEKTKIITEEVEKIASEIPEIDNYVVNIGSTASLGHGSGGGNGTHLANITVNLTDSKERDRKSFEISESLRPKLEAVEGAKVTVEELNAGPPSGAPIEVRIFGDDMSKLSTLAKDIQDFLSTVPGVINIKNNMENASGEFTFTVDKQKANYYGLSINQIASTLRNAVYGADAGDITRDGETIDIVVKYADGSFQTVNDLENTLIFTNTGETIQLKQVASANLNPSLLSIKHRDGDTVVIVSAYTEEGVNLQKVMQQFDEYQKKLDLPKGVSIKVGGETEDIQKSFSEIFYSMIVAVILIAFILVLQFNSFKQPFIIIFSLPLAIIGVIIGLNICGQPFSFPAFIGIVSLAGIVVNDAIVLIDRINKNIKHGMEFIEAIVEAGVARMQPIFLTSITTIAGIFPLIYADEMWRGLSLTVIFGLIFSTVLTLIVIPVIYAGMCKEKMNAEE